MNKEQQLRYIAGYIDGDGCFRANITTQKSGIVVYERSLTVTSVKKEPIEFFKEVLGGYTGSEQKSGNRRKTFTWTVKNTEAINVSKKILDFLIIKKEVCSKFIEYCENISFNAFRKVPVDILESRNRLIFEIRKCIHESDLIDREEIDCVKKERRSIDPTFEDYIYLAGLIDSEGCFRISKRYRKSSDSNIYNTVLEIGNTRISIIEWLAHRFGGSICFIPGKFPRKNSATWSLHSQSLYPLIKKVIDFLINKKDVCLELINFQKTILKNGGRRSSDSFKEEYRTICHQRDLIIERVHALNHKGK